VRRRLLAWLGLGCAACTPRHGPATPGVERIVFVGDSLVSRSDSDHRLLEQVHERLRHAHPGRTFELVNAGVSGDCIAEIRARLVADVGTRQPSAVVLYWDSDAANVEQPGDPPERVARLRGAYERDLAAVLDGLRGLTPRVVVSGPTLVGERPHGENAKDSVLDAYAQINRELCHLHHATWVDTRQAAFRWLRQNAQAPRDSGRLTEDGEHLSAIGVSLVATRLAGALSRHLGPPVPELPGAVPTPAEGE
jgi:lysophospholipase L1-like esterase